MIADAIVGLDVFGTQFNDNILADSGSFKGRLSGDDTFFSGGTKARWQSHRQNSRVALVTMFWSSKECRRATIVTYDASYF